MRKAQTRLTLLLICTSAFSGSAQDERFERLENVFQKYSHPSTRGAAADAVQDGKIVVEITAELPFLLALAEAADYVCG